MLATSALLTSVSFFSLRIRPGLFVPIKWRLPECPRLILPFAVNLKRFLAPRWVFNFNFGFDLFLGIAGNPLLTLMRCASRRVLKFERECQLGRSMLRPYKFLLRV